MPIVTTCGNRNSFASTIRIEVQPLVQFFLVYRRLNLFQDIKCERRDACYEQAVTSRSGGVEGSATLSLCLPLQFPVIQLLAAYFAY